jgi:hypothetical protein
MDTNKKISSLTDNKSEDKVLEEKILNDNKLIQYSELSLDDIFINLTLISKIEIGNKLTHNKKYINIDTNYFSFIVRWFKSIDRNSSINFINYVLNQAFIYNLELLNKLDIDSHLLLFRLTSDLKNCINGLVNLKQTYFHDKLVHSELDVMIDNIRSKIDMNSKKLKFTK